MWPPCAEKNIRLCNCFVKQIFQKLSQQCILVMPSPTYSHFISLPINSVLAKNYVQYLQLELLEAQPDLLDFQVPPRKLHLTVSIKNIEAFNYLFCICCSWLVLMPPTLVWKN